jgi:hypothetical protein
VCAEPSNKALKLTKRDTLEGGALRAPSSLSRASQLSAVFYRQQYPPQRTTVVATPDVPSARGNGRSASE